MSILEDFEGCRKRVLHFVFVIALIIGIIIFGGEFLSKLFGKKSDKSDEATKTELDNTNSETAK
jgi:uncharacterized membrane-anchored protein YhcB (DUF1043 family)